MRQSVQSQRDDESMKKWRDEMNVKRAMMASRGKRLVSPLRSRSVSRSVSPIQLSPYNTPYAQRANARRRAANSRIINYKKSNG